MDFLHAERQRGREGERRREGRLRGRERKGRREESRGQGTCQRPPHTCWEWRPEQVSADSPRQRLGRECPPARLKTVDMRVCEYKCKAPRQQAVCMYVCPCVCVCVHGNEGKQPQRTVARAAQQRLSSTIQQPCSACAHKTMRLDATACTLLHTLETDCRLRIRKAHTDTKHADWSVKTLCAECVCAERVHKTTPQYQACIAPARVSNHPYATCI